MALKLLSPNQNLIFATNCGDPLLKGNNPFPEIIEAILISQKYSTPSMLQRLEKYQAIGSLTISDNGNFSRMSSIAKKYFGQSNKILEEAKLDFKNTNKLAPATLEKRNDLIKIISLDCANYINELKVDEIISEQLESKPSYMIGLEDLTISVLDLAGLLDPVFEPKAKDIKTFQTKTREIYLKEKSDNYKNSAALKEIALFTVCHSYDYESALQAGNLYSNSNVDGLAVSFGGPMSHKNYISEIKLGKRIYKFKEDLPESYLLAISLLLGIIKRKSNKNLPVHILGLGSPILIVLLGYLLRNSKAVSIDATSTYKDAMDGNIYSSRNAFMKMDMYKVIAKCVLSGETFTSSSPYYDNFEKKYPSNWKKYKEALKLKSGIKESELVALIKSKPSLIEKHIPYFTPMRKGKDALIKDVQIARAGGNYWVLKKICQEIRIRKSNSAALKAWTDAEVEKYKQFASHNWSLAVQQAKEIIYDCSK